MTQSGNNLSQSENNAETLESVGSILQEFNLCLHYILLHKEGAVHLSSPINGFLNILLLKNSDNCICPYFINHNSYVIRGGENVIHTVTEGDVFEWKNIYERNIGLIIYIPTPYLAEFDLKFQQNSSRFKDGLLTSSDNRMQLLQSQLIELYQQPSLLNKLKIQSNLIEIIAHQIDGLMVENDKQQVIVVKNHYDKIMFAKKLIDNDVSKNFTIPELAKEVGTNEQYLKKYFKEYFGKTVSTYITERKMNYAKELIVSGDYRVADVARMTGYKHSTHFTTAFKKYFGFIPNSLRYTYLLAHGAGEVLAELETFIRIL
ncbi:AraC family transcriptional regulator [Sphingobacterium bovistauri]|uniref:Helix-turn-helix transcriptional regulator n=1 Tax=Sphingobacterium bovistauri TaxID=2781959 RepID=A0ABS7ZB17_9SPHI|nr:AraC family transcriptional regulator [Sphingobacterium bovistauri]MCA5006792.1 helix-turn-helix transcriptional regulator [Sphingobacterium bovistauri]